MSKKILVSILLLGIVLAVVGCSQASTLPDTQVGNKNVAGNTAIGENPATSETEAPQVPEEKGSKIVKIDEVLGEPESYEGQAVVVEGKIMSECGAGCWFTLNDGTGTIYVDLAPSNLVIPQKRGAVAKVYGEVVVEKGDAYIIGNKVEF